MARQSAKKDAVAPDASSSSATEAAPELDEDASSEDASSEDASSEDASSEDASSEVDEDVDELDDDVELDEEEDDAERSAQADAMWKDVRIEPVEIALPKGVGYTLRAYRMSNELTPTVVTTDDEDDFAILRRHEDVDEEEVIILENAELFADEPEEPAAPEPKRKRSSSAASSSDKSDKSDKSDSADDDEEPVASSESDDDDADSTSSEADSTSSEADESDDADESDEEDAVEEEEDEEEEEPEEVPAFLSHEGKLLLFRSVEGLVAFVQSDEEHDLLQLDTWDSLKTRITASSVVPGADDRYELDLVVENLRGGQDAWDTNLLLGAGEAARDLAYALRIEAVRTALSPGSPLDDLDEGLRAAASGGVGGFFAKRRLKKIGAQQAALGWRTIIGKISAVVDWRD